MFTILKLFVINIKILWWLKKKKKDLKYMLLIFGNALKANIPFTGNNDILKALFVTHLVS